MSRKIWRAFPELDPYDDETCQRYLRRARAMRGGVWHRVLIFFSVLLAFVLTTIVSAPLFYVLLWIAVWIKGDDKIGPYVDTLLHLLVFTTFIWVPWVSGLIARDKLLGRCVLSQLRGAACPGCGYSLIGLEVYGSVFARPSVRCPECGCEVRLADNDLTKGDISPELLGAT